jgi:hypothetical protein
MTFDEAVLDDADLLGRRDGRGLLWALATAGAQVRRSITATEEADIDRLRLDEPPRSVLVATDAMAWDIGPVLVRSVAAAAPAMIWDGDDLPRWAGPSDAMLIGALDGQHPRLAGLADQAVRRGLALTVTAPGGSAVVQAAAAGRAPAIEIADDLHPRAARWALLTPLVMASVSLGLIAPIDVALDRVADNLDETAELCRPQVETFASSVKSLTVELAESLPVLAGAGPLAGHAAVVIARALRLIAGVPAIAVELPDGAAIAGALLRDIGISTDPEDFFRDRTEEPPAPRARLLTIGDDGAGPLTPAPFGEAGLLPPALVAARRAAAALHVVADQRGLRASTLEVPDGPPLARYAAATAFGEFAAVYLALGFGRDPSELAPGEDMR